ncbi:peptidase S41 [Christiangramia fulva]|uniref:Peptidase S41 n=1 Tax=Christiangramia fulva TaxID=2126553 RepID=A0A2R3Z7A0_9FLAO|nr:S41 family peptidase [Christiangramia fulva]AVR46129.1 peptidase S41 [Christiangramia fulva]
MKKIFALLSLFALFTACQKEEIEKTNLNGSNSSNTSTGNNLEESVDYQVKDFVWTGLNKFYLYKEDVSELTDNFFSDNSERKDFYESYNSPENMFNGLLSNSDQFSFIIDDYNKLEEMFDGISGSTGIKYGFGKISGTNNYFGFIEYILPGTSAEKAGLERGSVFTEVNGQKLTKTNLQDLLSSSSITINVGKIVDGTIQMTNREVTLTDTRYTEDPIYMAKTFKEGNHTIGYLMYNSFIDNFDEELNTTFGDFKAQGVTDLVLDLRYNGGGSVETAIDLASMITGQFEDQVFMKEQWNKDFQEYFETYKPASIINRFDTEIRTGEKINSLNLDKVYVLTSKGTASASELVINGLEPYIDVIQIGDATRGKFQASVTLYDSPDFLKENSNLNSEHTYALQPLVFKSLNADGKTDYAEGLQPDIEYIEDLENMGTLGNTSEPMLQLAINAITGGTAKSRASVIRNSNKEKIEIIGQGNMNELNYQRMYIKKVPSIQ